MIFSSSSCHHHHQPDLTNYIQFLLTFFEGQNYWTQGNPNSRQSQLKAIPTQGNPNSRQSQLKAIPTQGTPNPQPSPIETHSDYITFRD